MPAIYLLVVASLSINGNLAVSLDEEVHTLDDDGSELELSYEIPHASLVFLKDSSFYTARFQIGVQLLDSQGNPLGGDVWQRSVRVHGYELTTSRDSTSIGSVATRLEHDVVRARVEVRDLASAQSATARFVLDRPTEGLRIRLLKHGQVHPARTYSLEDTVTAEVVVSGGGRSADSMRFLVRQGRRVLAGGMRPLQDTAGGRVSVFRLPVADSSGRSRLGSGSYNLEAVGAGPGPVVRGRVTFHVRIPLYFDDDAYMQRVDELLYVASAREMRRLKDLPPAEREQEWRSFWDSRDLMPNADRNEREEEYFERIDYSEENFAHGDKGYRSDRARVYVRYGPPDHREKGPFEVDQHAYEIWSYYNSGLEFVFVDRYGFGEYVLESPRFWHEG